MGTIYDLNGRNGHNGNYAGGGMPVPPPAPMGNDGGGGAATGNDSRVVRFAANVPEIVATKFADGKCVEGRFGEQWMYTLVDGRTMYVPPIVAEQINTLEIRPGEWFTICKSEVKEPGKSKPVIRWVVKKQLEQHPLSNPPQAAAPPAAPGGDRGQVPPTLRVVQAAGPTPPTKVPLNQAVVEAVRIVQSAMKETGEQWSDSAKQDLVSTILITGDRNGWVTLWERNGK